jgi:serine/threonine protein kinase
MYLHRETLSPVTKTLILLMLIHGISFLSDYEVFHLDLKPHNVMITKSMMVKIIDFGESYHRLVCNDDFIPGFTMPYGAPESYYPVDSNSFSSKNDIFSLGVIASELMNARLPFYFFNEEKHFERYT